MKEELNRIEGENGFFKFEKVKIMYEIQEFSIFCTFKNLQKNETEVRFIDYERKH